MDAGTPAGVVAGITIPTDADSQNATMPGGPMSPGIVLFDQDVYGTNAPMFAHGSSGLESPGVTPFTYVPM